MQIGKKKYIDSVSLAGFRFCLRLFVESNKVILTCSHSLRTQNAVKQESIVSLTATLLKTANRIKFEKIVTQKTVFQLLGLGIPPLLRRIMGIPSPSWEFPHHWGVTWAFPWYNCLQYHCTLPTQLLCSIYGSPCIFTCKGWPFLLDRQLGSSR
jgi:hypothetical protein